jgi:uronate dehydrogenase
MTNIVLTGAAGRLGSYLREPLAKMADKLVSTDIKDDIGRPYPGETYVAADLGDLDAMMTVIEGAHVVVHFGAIGDEAPFDDILHSNIVGAYNVWEAARRHGAKRIVYASSIHAVGLYPKNENIGVDVPHRPDSYYGLAKCFAEDLGRLYFEKCGIESVHLRIYSCAAVNSSRGLGAWLSYDDLIHLVTRSIDSRVTGFAICYGVSNNDRLPVDNASARFLGYQPKDNGERFAEQVFASEAPIDPLDPRHNRLGGPFAITELGQSGVALMNIADDKKTT